MITNWKCFPHCLRSGQSAVSFMCMVARALPDHRWFNVFPGSFTFFIWLYCITMARILVLVLLANYNWLYFVIFIMLDFTFYFCYYTKLMEDMSLEDLYNNSITSFRAIMTYIVPFKHDEYGRFIIIQLKVLIENIVIILITCCFYPGSAPKWLEEKGLYIIIGLYCIGLTLLALTPVLRWLTKIIYFQNILLPEYRYTN